jgi:hypothetical protein
VPRPDRLRAEQLFGQHPAHQEMRPGHGPERDALVGARQHGGVEALRPADQEAGGAPGLLPAPQQASEAQAVGVFAAEVERNRERIGRDGREQGRAFAAADLGR